MASKQTIVRQGAALGCEGKIGNKGKPYICAGVLEKMLCRVTKDAFY